MPQDSGEVHILLVEDNNVDAELIKEALKDCNLPHRLDLATDGEQAMSMLVQLVPHLVLLDLNLPKKPGLEVLQEIRKHPVLKPIPVIVMTNSRSQEDVVACYMAHCNAYVRKPIGFESLLKTLSLTSQFWFNAAELPRTVPIGNKWTLPPASLRQKAKAKKGLPKKKPTRRKKK